MVNQWAICDYNTCGPKLTPLMPYPSFNTPTTPLIPSTLSLNLLRSEFHDFCTNVALMYNVYYAQMNMFNFLDCKNPSKFTFCRTKPNFSTSRVKELCVWNFITSKRTTYIYICPKDVRFVDLRKCKTRVVCYHWIFRRAYKSCSSAKTI